MTPASIGRLLALLACSAIPLSGCVSYDVTRYERRTLNGEPRAQELRMELVENEPVWGRHLRFAPFLLGGEGVTLTRTRSARGAFSLTSLTARLPYLFLLTIPADLVLGVLTPPVALVQAAFADTGEEPAGEEPLAAGQRVAAGLVGPAQLHVPGLEDPWELYFEAGEDGGGRAYLNEPEAQRLYDALMRHALTSEAPRLALALEVPDQPRFVLTLGAKELADTWLESLRWDGWASRGAPKRKERVELLAKLEQGRPPKEVSTALERELERLAKIQASWASLGKRVTAARVAREKAEAAEAARRKRIREAGGEWLLKLERALGRNCEHLVPAITAGEVVTIEGKARLSMSVQDLPYYVYVWRGKGWEKLGLKPKDEQLPLRLDADLYVRTSKCGRCSGSGQETAIQTGRRHSGGRTYDWSRSFQKVCEACNGFGFQSTRLNPER